MRGKDIDDDEKELQKTKFQVRARYKAKSYESSKRGNDIQIDGILTLSNYYEVKPFKGSDTERHEKGGVVLNVCDQSDSEYNPVERDLKVELTATVINEILDFAVKHNILEISMIKLKDKNNLYLTSPSPTSQQQ